MVRRDGSEGRLVAIIKSAQEGGREWMACLTELHDAFDADSTVMYAPPHAGRPFVPFLLHKVDVSRIAAKLRAYSGSAPFLDAAIEQGLAPGTFCDRDIAASDESEHHREVLEPMKWSDGLQFVLRLPCDPRGGLVLKLWRFHPKPAFGESERQLARRLYTPLATATERAFFTEPSAPAMAASPAAIEGFSTPSIILSIEGNALSINKAAERLIDADDVVALRNGRVALVGKVASGAFRQALEQASADQTKEGIEIVVGRSGERAPVLCVVSPVPDHQRAGFAEGAVAIAHFFDVESHEGHTLQAQRAQLLFGLTAAECEILRLVLDGLTLKEIAAQRASSAATVRTQIKSILNKTRSRRQQDLMRFRRLAN